MSKIEITIVDNGEEKLSKYGNENNEVFFDQLQPLHLLDTITSIGYETQYAELPGTLRIIADKKEVHRFGTAEASHWGGAVFTTQNETDYKGRLAWLFAKNAYSFSASQFEDGDRITYETSIDIPASALTQALIRGYCFEHAAQRHITTESSAAITTFDKETEIEIDDSLVPTVLRFERDNP